MSKVVVIGGGPAGMTVAYHLAKRGHEVSVFEEHPVVGDPFQCTGILTGLLEDFVELDDSFFMNKIDEADICVKDQKVHFNLKRKNIIVDRTRFDQWLGKRAEKEGVKVFELHKYLSNTATHAIIKDVKAKKEKEISFDFIIGADGPRSPVGTFNKLKGTRRFWFGAQARAHMDNKNVIGFYPSIGTYAWIVPENASIVRIGIAAEQGSGETFKQFMKDMGITRIIDYQGGLIPRYDPKMQTQKGNIYLLGDAATQVKATTGGGILPGMLAAECLAEAIDEGKNYEKLWKKKLGRELWIHLKMRQVMDKFQPKDWDFLMRLFTQDRTRSIVEQHDRELPSTYLWKLFIKEPRLVYFTRFLF